MIVARSFSSGLAWRITGLFIAALGVAVAVAWPQHPNYWMASLIALAAVQLSFNLFRYVNDTNRRLARFFESVRYSDFAIRFSSGKEKGDSFEAVNRQFNEVLEAFRQTRAEKEANLLFLNAMVQHLSTGIIAFDAQNNVLISNNAALQLLGLYRLHHLSDLPERHRPLIQLIVQLNGKGKVLYQPETNRQLSVQGVALNLQGRAVRLLTLQNIHTELQRKEVDAWRNLTRVLRHEMMNSITPIVSLVETAQDIVRCDLPSTEASADLSEALEVVATRSRGLVNFVEAYRSFTSVPDPKMEDIHVRKLLERVLSLTASDNKQQQVKTEMFVDPEDLKLKGDAGQLEMILINLVKNARESFDQKTGGGERRITLRAGADTKGKAFIEVEDNGPGIAPELLEEIFIPFFTTKPTGTGIGLSLSRQIMQLHGGDIRAGASVGGGARFVLEF